MLKIIEPFGLSEEERYIEKGGFDDVTFSDMMEAEELEELRIIVFSTLKQLIFKKMLCMEYLYTTVMHLDVETITNARVFIDYIVEVIEDKRVLHQDGNHWTHILSVYDNHCALDFECSMIEEMEYLEDIIEIIKNLKNLDIDEKLVYYCHYEGKIDFNEKMAEKLERLIKLKFFCIQSYCEVLDLMRIEQTNHLYYNFPELIPFENQMFFDHDLYEQNFTSLFIEDFLVFQETHRYKSLLEELSNITG